MIKTFLLGATVYPALELLWRGRTHYAMAIAGGSAAVMICKIRRTKGSLLTRMLLCGAGITAIEYVCGMIWNREHHIWDYRNMPCNLQGQICLPYSLLWCGLGVVAMRVLPE